MLLLLRTKIGGVTGLTAGRGDDGEGEGRTGCSEGAETSAKVGGNRAEAAEQRQQMRTDRNLVVLLKPEARRVKHRRRLHAERVLIKLQYWLGTCTCLRNSSRSAVGTASATNQSRNLYIDSDPEGGTTDAVLQ